MIRTGLLVAVLVVALAGTVFLVRYELSSPNRGPLMDEIDGRLAETLPPGRGSRLEARDERVRHYDVEFRFGPDGLLLEGECRRVSVPIGLADESLENDRYRAFDLWQGVERGDGDETVTTL